MAHPVAFHAAPPLRSVIFASRQKPPALSGQFATVPPSAAVVIGTFSMTVKVTCIELAIASRTVWVIGPTPPSLPAMPALPPVPAVPADPPPPPVALSSPPHAMPVNADKIAQVR